MSSSSNSALEMRFTASIKDIERELAKLQRLNNKATQNLAQAHQRAAQQSQAAWSRIDLTRGLQGQIGSVGGIVRQYAGILAGAFAGREALSAAETWTKFSNSLKVAGLAGTQLKTVQEALYQSAIKNGVALEPLGQLYGRLSQSQKELGANSAQMLQFTNGITAALRVQGGDASQASGALMQLSQALAGGVVRAEEFNSINEGARPILEAVAAGWEKQGMTVAKLRAVMIDGKLTSKEFFDSFLRGASILEERAAKAPLTVGASMTVLHTAMTKYIGETDQAWNVTSRISAAIQMLAQNLDTVKNAVMVVGGIYAATFIPALARGSAAIATNVAASISSTAAMAANTVGAFANATALGRIGMMANGAAVAQRGLAAALGFFGGPVGIAITAIGAALAYLAVSSAQAAAETEALSRRIEANAAELDAANTAATKKRIETGNLTSAERAAAFQTAALTGEVHKLKDAYYLAAAAAKALAVAEAWQKHKSAVTDMKGARAEYDAKVEEERSKARQSRNRGSGEYRGLYTDVPLTPEQDAQIRNRVLNQSDQGMRFRKSVDVAVGFQTNAQQTEKESLKTFGTGAPTASAATSKKTGGGGRKGKSADDIADTSQAAIDAANKEYHAALHASAVSAEERHKYALEALEEDKAEKLKRIEKQAADKDITAAAAATVKGKIEEAHLQSVANENYRRTVELAEQQAQVSQARLDLDNDAIRAEVDSLEQLANGTRNLRERQKYERLALQKRQEADDVSFKVAQDQLALDREKAGWTLEEIKALRAKAEANRATDKRNEQRGLDQRQANDGPRSVGQGIKDYAESFGSLNEQLTNIAAQGIDNVTRGLTDAIMGAKSLKEAFSDMAKSIISSLIEMAMKFAIFEAIGMAFGMPGLGKAAIGIGKNAAGTNNWRGGLTMVGEKGPELAYLPRGSQVMPNNVLNAAQAASAGGYGRNGGATSVSIHTTVNANDAVLTGWVKNEVQKGTATAVQAAQKLIPQNIAHRNRNSFR